MKATPTSIMVAILTGEERHFWIHPQLLMVCARMTIWQQETKSKFFLTTVHGATPVDAARNIAVAQLLQTNAEWLLQIDNDTVPPMNVLSILEEIEDRKIVGFPCPIEHPSGNVCLNIGRTHRDNLQGLVTSLAPGWSQMDVVGSGCLLIHRDVFLSLDQPWFECSRASAGTSGEDFSFCGKVRALGFSIWTHSNFACQHFRTVELGKRLRTQTQQFI